MSITDELREWWVRKFPVMDKELHKDFTAIADRIDAEHERLMQEQPFTIDMVPITDESMAEHGWLRLPKDADGVPIHVGDKLIDEDNKLQKPAIVKCILYNDEGCVVSNIDPRGCWYDPSLLRHHHAPTVEDVLREFTDAILEWSGKSGTVAEVGTWSDVAAEYAKRLRLVNDEE